MSDSDFERSGSDADKFERENRDGSDDDFEESDGEGKRPGTPPPLQRTKRETQRYAKADILEVRIDKAAAARRAKRKADFIRRGTFGEFREKDPAQKSHKQIQEEKRNAWKLERWDKLYQRQGKKSLDQQRAAHRALREAQEEAKARRRAVGSSRGRRKNRSRGVSRARVHELSRPKKIIRPKFASPDDAKHCTFRPKITAYQSESKDDDVGAPGSSERFQQYLNRIEAKEEARQRSLKLKIGEKAYKARLDKKTCNECGEAQSYDEFTNKRNYCACGGKFVTSKDYERRMAQFHARMEADHARKKERMRAIVQNRRQEVLSRSFVHKRRGSPEEDTREWKHVQRGFLERMKKQETERRRRLEATREKYRSKERGEAEAARRKAIALRARTSRRNQRA
jgi:hypothetical protein